MSRITFFCVASGAFNDQDKALFFKDSQNVIIMGGALPGMSSYATSLSEVKFDKGMYRPAYVSLTFTASKSDNAAGSLENLLKTELMNKSFLIDVCALKENKVKLSNADDLVYIARNHYIHGFEISCVGADSYSFTLNCYSFDKKLTLRRYCRAYSGKRLAADICPEVINNVSLPSGVSLYDFSPVNLLMLGYDMLTEKEKNELARLKTLQNRTNLDNKTESERAALINKYKEYGLLDSNNKVNENALKERSKDGYGHRWLKNTKELKHPYLVQYNESPYEFIARVAHRCGEFFYFEDGKIRLGLPEATRKLAFDNTYSPQSSQSPHYTYSCINKNDDVSSVRSAVTPYSTNYVMGNPEPSKGKFHLDLEHVSDEDFHTLTKDDNRIAPMCQAVTYNFFASVFTMPENLFMTLGTSSSNTVLEILNRAVFYPRDSKKWYKKHHLDGRDINSELTNELGLGQTDEYKYSKQYVSNMSNEVLNVIESWEDMVEQGRMTLNFGSYMPNLKLGDAFKMANAEGCPSVLVTEMSGKFSSVEDNAEESVASTVTDINVVALPFVKLGDQTTGASSDFYLIPVPARSSVAHVHSMSPMEAVVTDNNDPLRLGRVRVRFIWQSESEDKSPWIRVSVPFAGGGSESGGFCMVPSVGEHVMLDFIDGNPERPFVNGSLYYRNADKSKDHIPSIGMKPDDRRFYRDDYMTRSIVSGNGHAIIFKDLEDTNFMYQVLPMMGVVAQATQVKKFSKTGKEQNPIPFGTIKGGGITIKDGTGMCKVDINPNTRTLTLDSKFGTVEMNAFTGITINAPNGDVTIRGKNIVMEAGNNLVLQAGKNVDNGLGLGDHLAERIGGIAGKAGKALSFVKSMTGIDFSKAFDLSYLRSILEVVLKPVEGTLTIKSNRNLIMTAGTGKVTPHSSLISRSTTLKSGEGKTSFISGTAPLADIKKSNDDNLFTPSAFVYIVEVLKMYMKEVDSFYGEYKTLIQSFYESVNSLCEANSQNKVNLADDYIESIYDDKGVISKSKIYDILSTNSYSYKETQNNDNNKVEISFGSFPKKIVTNVYVAAQEWFHGTTGEQANSLISNQIEPLWLSAAQKYAQLESYSFSELDKKLKLSESQEKDVVIFPPCGGKITIASDTGNVTVAFGKFDNEKYGKSLSLTPPQLSGNQLDGDEPLYPYGKAKHKASLVNDVEDFQESVERARLRVKKFIIVKTLTQCGAYIDILDAKNKNKISDLSTSFDGFKDYIMDDSKRFGWQRFLFKIMPKLGEDETAPSRLERGVISIFSTALKEGMGGGLEYKDGKLIPAPGLHKLLGVDGAAGPREIMGERGQNGTILISSDSGSYQQFNSANGTWETRYNPDIEVLKQYLLTVLN